MNGGALGGISGALLRHAAAPCARAPPACAPPAPRGRRRCARARRAAAHIGTTRACAACRAVWRRACRLLGRFKI
jgi:hypothetical protein